MQLPAPTTTGSESFFDIVFDPVNELVYVGCPETDAAPGQVLALDARDLTVRWTYLTKQIFRAPRLALNGTQLCFPDDQNILYMFDTRDALAQTKEKGGSPKPRWTWQVADPSNRGLTRPVLANGQVYVAVWDFGRGTNIVFLAECNADDGSNPQSKDIGATGTSTGTAANLTTAPVLGRVRAKDQTEPQALYIYAARTRM